MKRLMYWYWRKYKDIPHPSEITDLYIKSFPESVEDKDNTRWGGVALDYIWYIDGKSTIKNIAEDRKVSRERVRQCIWKAYRKWGKS